MKLELAAGVGRGDQALASHGNRQRRHSREFARGLDRLAPAVFEVKVKPDLFHAEVRRQLAARHTGTHSTKNRAHGVGRRLEAVARRRAPAARARAARRSPQWSGGGVVFGPVPRSYEHSLSKKVRRAGAARRALAAQQQEGAITVVDELALSEFKTKRVAGILTALGLAGQSVLIVIARAPTRSSRPPARNLPRVGVIRVEGLNVYDVLRAQAARAHAWPRSRRSTRACRKNGARPPAHGVA